MANPMTHTRELPFASSLERAFRFGYWTLRLGGRPRPDSLPEIIVSRKLGFLCAAIPLCGTRALKNFFLSNPKIDFEAKLLRDTVPNVLRMKNSADKPLLFSVVRNPWSRVVSCYEKKIRGAYVKRSYSGYRGVTILAAHEGLYTTMSFEEFVEWLCDERGRDEVANRHWMSQYRFLSLSEIKSECYHILRLESMEEELNALLARVGLGHQAIKKMNSSATTASDRLYIETREYYTSKTINAVGDRYAKDIELFGYDYC
jgi:hypothetical protein